MAAELERHLTNPRIPAILDKLDASPEIRQKALDRLAMSEEHAARTGDPARKDIQNARRILGDPGPEGGFRGLFRARARGEWLPGLGAVGLGLGAAGLGAGEQRQN
jgi:hypothetical protein